MLIILLWWNKLTITKINSSYIITTHVAMNLSKRVEDTVKFALGYGGYERN